ncbi:DUF2924 domain-containing protein [Phenylobacterium sp.]|uniref:DUF2924 domain-containing protein n=1 Tax=Phenylobacterium sp. TaxID=1871053 RepID=UPI0039839564
MDLDQNALSDVVEAEIRLIEHMQLSELRALWMARWGSAPRFRSVDLLRRLIAWRLQAESFGGLDAETRILLGGTSIPQPPGPPPGSRLTREYLGVLHHVDVGEQAFSYQGTIYRSLSAVARKITGSRWNGPRFFGLREPASAR